MYLVRHGQAGTRKAYDSLSELGRRQSRLLGEYFVSEGLHFAAAISGALARQTQTAAEVRAAYCSAGILFPEIAVDCGWNEFDLTHVYRALAPRLCADDTEFRREYEEMRTQARAAEHEHDAVVNRRWLPCDMKLVNAWIEGRYAYDGETWPSFRARVIECRSRLEQVALDGEIVIFTSATPIGIWTAAAMDIHDDRALRLAGVLRNASCTAMRLRAGHLRLDSFNNIAHLGTPDLRTYR
ncbi:MAG TPA: histidine phosphatase family protein [Bryobacteraceae bacterium]